MTTKEKVANAEAAVTTKENAINAVIKTTKFSETDRELLNGMDLAVLQKMLPKGKTKRYSRTDAIIDTFKEGQPSIQAATDRAVELHSKHGAGGRIQETKQMVSLVARILNAFDVKNIPTK